MFFHRICEGPIRRFDQYGSGTFGASRGGRPHHGLDIVVQAGEAVKSPIGGNLHREAVPYRKDPRFRGVAIQGTGEWEEYHVKMFYIEGFFSGAVYAGEIVGYAQDLTIKYHGITNHVHLEVEHNGVVVDPAPLFGQSF